MSDLPSVRVHPNAIIYRASASGYCARQLLAARLGYEPKPYPEKFQKIFERGHQIEDMVRAILLSQTWTLINNQYEVSLDLGAMVELLPVQVIGHIDFDSKSPTDNAYILTEVKGFGKDWLKIFEREDIWGFPKYCYQIASYLYARNQKRWRLVIYKKTTQTYPEDSFQRLVIRDYEKPPILLDDIVLHLSRIESAKADGLPVGRMLCQSEYPCPYYYLHDNPNEKPTEKLTDKQLALARAVKILDAKLELLNGRREKMRQQLIDNLTPDYKYLGPDLNINFVANSDRITADKVKAIMKAAGVEEDEYMKKGSGKQMRISKK